MLALALLLAAQVHFAGDEAADPFAAKSEAEALASLRSLEARLSLSQTASPAEVAAATAAVRASAHPSVRALAAAVLAWFDPATATPPLLAALKDAEPRVRAVSYQSLLSLSRRFDDAQRRPVVSAALAGLDDKDDEAACASAELLNNMSPSAAADAMRARADNVGDVRYACFQRFAGLPTRTVNLPPMPTLEPVHKPDDGDKTGEKPPPPTPPSTKKPVDGSWLFVGTAASAGLVAGGVLPSAFLPSRDVLLYTEERTKLTHEEVAFPSQAGAGIVGAAVLGGSAYALSTFVRPLTLDEAGAVAIGTGALGVAGGSAQLAFALHEGPASLATAAGVTVGFAATTGLAYGFSLDVNDEVLAASFAGVGALASGLAAFSAVPVGYTNVGDALRVDFGLGVIGMGAGTFGFLALAAGSVLDVPPSRSMAMLSGAALGGGLFLATGFLVAPASDVKSRIACGIGLGGLVVGATIGLLVPDEWIGTVNRHGPAKSSSSSSPASSSPASSDPASSEPASSAPAVPVGTAVNVEGGKVSLGIPIVVTFDDGRQHGLAATLVTARF